MLLVLCGVGAAGCGGKPWSLIVRSAQSELRPAAQVQDRLLQSSLRRALLTGDPTRALDLRAYVFMDRAFVVGEVDSTDERSSVESIARSVEGLRSVTFHLPVAVEGDGETEGGTDGAAGWTDHAELRARMTADPTIVASRVEIDVVQGQVVLLGVVASREQRRVLEAARSIAGEGHVVSFMLEPERGYARRRLGLR